MEISAHVLGEKVISRKLLGIGDRAVNLTPALNEIADFWMEVEQELFTSEGASSGRPWAPIDPATAERKSGGRILADTGGLLASLTEKGAADQILEVNDDMLIFGTGHVAGRFHQQGTTHMDRRRPLDIQSQGGQVKRQTTKILQRFIVTGERGRSL